MAISTNGTVLARLAGALYNTQMSNATYSEVKTLDPATLADALYARDFSASTDAAVATTLVTNLGLASVAGLDNWVAAQLTAAGSHKGAKIVDLLNSFAQMTADTTYGAYATAFNTKVDAALALSQTTGNAGGTFAAAGVAPAPVNGTFALTTSIDAIVGGAGDDAITAAATSASTGTANTTVNSGDSVDGGAGTDTLTITATAANNNSLSGLTVTGVEKVVIAGSDNLAVTAAGSATVAAGAAQIIDWAVADGAAATAATHAITAVINGVTYTTTYSGNATLATGVSNKQAAIVTLLNTVLGGTATAAGTSPEITLTSSAKGAALPTITITEVANGATAADATAAVAADTATGFKTIANALKTDAAAVKEVLTVTVSEGSTAGYVANNTFTVYIDGVNYGSPVLTTDSTQNTVLTALASSINGVIGTGSATVTGNTMTITAPVAGVPLPHISIKGGGTDAGASTFTVARENVAVGATTTTTSTAATVAATQFTGATSIAVDGNATTVSALTTQSVTLSGATMSNTLKYSSTATSATIVGSAAAGTVTLDDNSTTTLTTGLKTATVSGTIKTTAASTTNHTATANGTLTLVDSLGVGGAGTIETLNLGVTSQGTLGTSGLAALKSVDASASTGNLTLSLDGAYLASVKGGSGNDSISADFDTDVNGGVNIATSALLDGGAGNDSLSLSNTNFGTGTLTVNGGAGDDTVSLASAALTANITVTGGDGTDTFYFTPGTTALTTGELTLIGSQVSGFEKFRAATLTSADASKLTAFSSLAFDAAATVTKVSDAQALTFVDTATAQAATYILKDSPTGNAANLTATQYGGALTINASGASKTITAKADSVTLNVNDTIPTGSSANDVRVASTVTLTGDVKTATVNLASSANYATGPTTDIISTITITPTNTVSATAGTDSGNFTALGNLTSLTLKGVGTVKLDNDTTSGSTSTSKLVTIDASALGGVYGAYDTTNAGTALGGLRVNTNTYLAETVTLGTGKDLVNVLSTVDKTDTITNFNLVMNSDGTVNTTKSDSMEIMHSAAFVKMTTGLTGSTFGAVLTQVAASANDQVIFQYGGDTYIFVDATGTGVLDAADTLVKLTGNVDMDGLVLLLGSSDSTFTAL